MRFLLTLAASAVAALMAFRSIYPQYDSLYPLRDGLVMGGAFFGVLKVFELAAKRHAPWWITIPMIAILTAAAYREWHIMLMI